MKKQSEVRSIGTRRTVACVCLGMFALGCAASGPSLMGVDSGVDNFPDGGSTMDGGVVTPEPCSGPTQVAVEHGCLEGQLEGPVRAFLGVPYAAPPVGELRFRAPVPSQPWSGARGARTRSLACPQLSPLIGGEHLEWSEDCLYLNVWSSPPLASKALRPVMVWIHGGGLSTGSGSHPLYDGRRLAEGQGVVVVTLNYRLGQLGFLAHPALSAEDTEHHVSGNWGFRDQIEALRWVKRNIAAFGGDPDNVTLFGESAGGLSTCTMLTLPLARGLFHRVIAQSGVCPHAGPWARPLRGSTAQLESAEELGLQVASKLGCTSGDVATCLRSKTATEVLQALPAASGMLSEDVRYGVTVEGSLVPRAPWELVRSGAAARVPVLLGTNADEATIFSYGRAIDTEAAYLTLLNQQFGPAAQAIHEAYPTALYGSPHAAFDAAFGDMMFTCPMRSLARALSSRSPTFLYQFSYATLAHRQLGLGAWHGAELAFVFGTLDTRKRSLTTAAELLLSGQMQARWAAFAASGSPNPPDTQTWRPYVVDEEAYLRFDTPIAFGTFLRQGRCDALDAALGL
jgi:para-nitrobenzyl esterase